jgi:hypothetical protein
MPSYVIHSAIQSSVASHQSSVDGGRVLTLGCCWEACLSRGSRLLWGQLEASGGALANGRKCGGWELGTEEKGTNPIDCCAAMDAWMLRLGTTGVANVAQQRWIGQCAPAGSRPRCECPGSDPWWCAGDGSADTTLAQANGMAPSVVALSAKHVATMPETTERTSAVSITVRVKELVSYSGRTIPQRKSSRRWFRSLPDSHDPSDLTIVNLPHEDSRVRLAVRHPRRCLPPDDKVAMSNTSFHCGVNLRSGREQLRELLA